MNKRRFKINIFTAILVVLIIIIIVVLGKYYKRIANKQVDRDIKANMLLIQGVCKVKKQRFNVSKKEQELIGTKISDKKDDVNIKKFIKDLNIPESDFGKYYILYDSDLKKLELDMKNEDGALYIVNYDVGEVYITKSYNGKFKLSEIDK